MKNYFSDYRIYIGIQVDSIPKWKEIISEYKENGLDITYSDVNPNLYVNSDVSGYQKALELLYNSTKTYFQEKLDEAIFRVEEDPDGTNTTDRNNKAFYYKTVIS